MRGEERYSEPSGGYLDKSSFLFSVVKLGAIAHFYKRFNVLERLCVL